MVNPACVLEKFPLPQGEGKLYFCRFELASQRMRGIISCHSEGAQRPKNLLAFQKILRLKPQDDVGILKQVQNDSVRQNGAESYRLYAETTLFTLHPSTFQPFNHSTVQPSSLFTLHSSPFNPSTLQPFNHSTLQPFNLSTFQLFNPPHPSPLTLLEPDLQITHTRNCKFANAH